MLSQAHATHSFLHDIAGRRIMKRIDTRSSSGEWSDGTLRTGSGNGYNITGYRTFATWLRCGDQQGGNSFQVHLDTSAGRKALVYRPDLSTTNLSGNDYIVGIAGKAGDFDEGQWVRLERDV